MRLFVTNPNTHLKEYLNIVVATRQDLANYIGSAWFNFNGNQYHVHQVIAEGNSDKTTSGAVIGGLIGLLAGPFGALIGGAIGGALGNDEDRTELNKINYFNRSTV